MTDVTDRASVQGCVDATVDRFGSLEIVVHNAYTGSRPHRLEDTDLAAHWDAASRTGVWAVQFCAAAGYPHLRAAGARGRFVLITSPSGVEGSANIPLYSP